MGEAKRNLAPALQRELDALAQARDELKLQIHLAKADAKDEWNRLEKSWLRVEDELRRARDSSSEPLKEIGAAARQLLDELKEGYARVKSELRR